MNTHAGHYELIEPLGEGTYGVVWRARHVRVAEIEAAVKVLRPELSSDPDFVAGLERECALLHRLRHPHIVGFRDLIVRDGLAAVVLELLEGDDLHEVSARGPLPPDEVDGLLDQVLSALAHAHAAGVIHRDIKPSNVFRCTDGSIRLLDFGIARAADAARATRTGQLAGTYDYMAPEVFEGRTGGAPGDLYAAGLVAWELLAGRRACPEGAPATKMGWHLGVGPADVRTVAPTCPDELAARIAALCRREPEARTGADGAAQTAAVREEQAPGASPSPTPPPGGGRRGRPPPQTVQAPLPPQRQAPEPEPEQRSTRPMLLGMAALVVLVVLGVGGLTSAGVAGLTWFGTSWTAYPPLAAEDPSPASVLATDLRVRSGGAILLPFHPDDARAYSEGNTPLGHLKTDLVVSLVGAVSADWYQVKVVETDVTGWVRRDEVAPALFDERNAALFDPLSYVRIKNGTWIILPAHGSDDLLFRQFSLANESSFDMTDIVVETEFMGPNGELLATQQFLIEGTIAPQSRTPVGTLEPRDEGARQRFMTEARFEELMAREADPAEVGERWTLGLQHRFDTKTLVSGRVELLQARALPADPD